MSSTAIRRALVALGCAIVVAGGSALATAADADPDQQAAAVEAGQWLSAQRATEADAAAYDAANPETAGRLVEGTMPSPSFGGPSPTDWGLTIDALFALEATGTDPAAAALIADRLDAHVLSYISYADFIRDDPDAAKVRVAGAVGKELAAAVVSGRNARQFGGLDRQPPCVVTADGPSSATTCTSNGATTSRSSTPSKTTRSIRVMPSILTVRCR